MPERIYIGVDGGATKCHVQIENANGELLGKATTGPANIRISVQDSWYAILSAIEKILKPHGISLQNTKYEFHAGMGLAGCEVEAAYRAFINYKHPLHKLTVTYDSHIACLGAHAGRDGGIIIVGTGVVGLQIYQDKVAKVGGWGFPHDDEGGGAWLGLQAMKKTLQWLDGRKTASALVNEIYEHFDKNKMYLVDWANSANSTAFATLAPFVVRQMQNKDDDSLEIMSRAASHLNKVHQALSVKQPALPFSLIGSLSAFIEPFLPESLQQCLRPKQFSPEVGAILLVKENRDSIVCAMM